jgi:hypothetical protein
MAVSVIRSRKIDLQAALALQIPRPSDSPSPALTLDIERDSLPSMALLRGLFWLVLFVVLAFSFVVLFEYGPHNFGNGFQKEFARVKTFIVKQTEKPQKPKKRR